MKLKINIPTSLDDITLRQYKHYFKIQENNKEERFLQAKMIEVFCNVKLKDVMQMRYNDTQEVISILDKLFQSKPKLVKKFKLGKINYGFHPSLDELSLGEYIDLDTYVSDWSNIEKAMNVLYRPITARFQDKYAIEDYKVTTSDSLLDMPMSAVTSSIFFLWSLGIDLSKTMMNYLDKGQKQVLTDYLNLEQNGVGINHFMGSLEEILQSLNISQN
jgi:hypothetical protein